MDQRKTVLLADAGEDAYVMGEIVEGSGVTIR